MKMVHITIQTTKMEESVEFYQNVLGMSVQGRFQGLGGKSIAFLGNQESEVRIELIEGEMYTGSGISIGFHVSNVEDTHQWMQSRGVNPSPILYPNLNTQFFFIKDPNGVNIQII